MKVKLTANGDFLFLCPGCNRPHIVDTRWKFTGSMQSPTFYPSIHIHYGDRDLAEHPKMPKYVCHSFVTDGKIQFLDDCTHSMRNQCVELPEINNESTY